MLYQYLRLLRGTNGTITDLSIQNQDESATVPCNLTTAQDYFYIGQQFPFNNFYIQMDTVNDVAANMTIEYWDGSAWQDAVDILDATGGLFKSGLVQFSPDVDYKWSIITDTSLSTSPTDLNAVTIYNLYWIRISFDATINASCDSKKITYCFSSSQMIDNYDTTINSYLTAFSVGKTSWEEEIITASKSVVLDLKRVELIINKGQIIKIEDVNLATNWRTLMHIYFNLGGDYKPKYDLAVKEYEKAISLKTLTESRTEYEARRLRRE